MDNKNKIQNKAKNINHKGISIYTSASIDTMGVASLHYNIRNKNYFSKRRVSLVLTLINDGNIIYKLESGYIPLYGTFSSLLCPHKKSSVASTKYGKFSFDDILLEDPTSIYNDPKVADLNQNIHRLASEIRKVKVLVDAQDDEHTEMTKEFDKLVSEITRLKAERMSTLKDIETQQKFSGISIDVDYHVV